MLEILHQRIECLCVGFAGCELSKPFAEGLIEGPSLCASNSPRLLDKIFFGAQGDVFHTRTVYTILVLLESIVRREEGVAKEGDPCAVIGAR